MSRVQSFRCENFFFFIPRLPCPHRHAGAPLHLGETEKTEKKKNQNKKIGAGFISHQINLSHRARGVDRGRAPARARTRARPVPLLLFFPILFVSKNAQFFDIANSAARETKKKKGTPSALRFQIVSARRLFIFIFFF